MNKKRHHLTQSEVIDQMPLTCSNELLAVEFMEEPAMGQDAGLHPLRFRWRFTIWRTKTGQRNTFLWRRKDCGKQYTVSRHSLRRVADSTSPLVLCVLACSDFQERRGGFGDYASLPNYL